MLDTCCLLLCCTCAIPTLTFFIRHGCYFLPTVWLYRRCNHAFESRLTFAPQAKLWGLQNDPRRLQNRPSEGPESIFAHPVTTTARLKTDSSGMIQGPLLTKPSSLDFLDIWGTAWRVRPGMSMVMGWTIFMLPMTKCPTSYGSTTETTHSASRRCNLGARHPTLVRHELACQ